MIKADIRQRRPRPTLTRARKTWLVAFCTFVCSNAIYAAGWSPMSVVTLIEGSTTGGFICLDGAIPGMNVNACTNPNCFYLYNSAAPTAPTGWQNAMFAQALAAKMTNKQIRIYSAGCLSGYNSANNLDN